MPVISFEDARLMASESEKWMADVAAFIDDPSGDPPQSLYSTQKLVFEIGKEELSALLKSDKVLGILGKEAEAESLTVILVGLNKDGKPEASSLPRQTWPKLNSMSQIEFVLTTYLTP